MKQTKSNTNEVKPIFYYSYENEEHLNNGGFVTFEDAKESAIEQYKSDLADLDEGDNPNTYLPTEFTIGECYPPNVIAKDMIPNMVDTIIEQLYETLIDKFYTEDAPTIFDNDDKQILTDVLHRILDDENRWSYEWIADNRTTFKFKEVLNEEQTK